MKQSILIIDDNESIRQTLAMILNKKGYDTSLAGTGREALDWMNKNRFNLAILDVRLPDIVGTELLKQLKDMSHDMAVIMMSGHASVENVAQAMDNDADAYLTKPLNMDNVLERVNHIMDKQRLIGEKKLAEEKLLKERTLFNAFLNNIPDTVYFKDKDARFVRVSRSMAELFHVQPDEMIGKTDEDFFPENLAAAKLQNDHSLMKTEIPLINYEEKDNDETWISTTKLPWYDAEGKIIGMFGMSRDITELKNAQISLELERDRARLYFDAAGVMIIVLDDKADVLQINKKGCDILGYDQNEIVGMNWIDTCIPKRLRQEVHTLFEHNLESIRDYKDYNENPVLTRDGSERIIAWYNTPLFDDSGNIIGVLGSGEDITRRKETEAKLNDALQQSRQRQNEISAIHDASTKLLQYTDFNQAARMLFDSCKDLIGATAGYVALLNEKGDENEVLFLEAGGRPCTVDPDLPMPIRGLRAESYKTQKVVYDNDFANSEWMQYMPDGHVNLENVMFAPLNIDNKTVGIIGLANKPGGFNEHDAQIASSYGELAAISLNNCRILDTLRANEEKFRAIASSAQDAIIMMDEKGVITFWNESAERIFGYNAEESIGQTLHRLIVPEKYHAAHHLGLDRFNKTGKGDAVGKLVELTGIRKDGGEFPVEISLSAVDMGGIWHSVGIIRDISDRKKAEAELRKNEQLYRNVVENIGIGVAVIDTNMKIITLNNQMKEWYPEYDENAQSFCYKLFHDPQSVDPCLNCPTHQTLHDGEVHKSIITHDDARYFKIVSTPIFDLNGNIIAVVELVEDITEELRLQEERKKYAENLEAVVKERTKDLQDSLVETKEARDRIDVILKSVAEGIIVTDTQNRIILMNRASELLLGVTIKDVVNSPVEKAFDDQNFLDRVKTVKNRGIDNAFTFEFNKENHQRILQARVSDIHDVKGVLSGAIISFHDVTREHEIDRIKTEFISTAAHELRTPLTSIRGFSEILNTRKDLKDEERAKFLGYINKQSVRLSSIISNILDIARIESGKGFELNREKCDIHDILKQVTALFSEQSGIHTFVLDIPDDPVYLDIDMEKIEQMMKNLFSNAVKYSPDGGEILIQGSREEHVYRLDISDPGIGMSKEELERIYEKFYRADASNTAIEGTGLGMSIVKQIIEAHGGKIKITSTKNIGTKVTVTLPI